MYKILDAIEPLHIFALPFFFSSTLNARSISDLDVTQTLLICWLTSPRRHGWREAQAAFYCKFGGKSHPWLQGDCPNNEGRVC